MGSHIEQDEGSFNELCQVRHGESFTCAFNYEASVSLLLVILLCNLAKSYKHSTFNETAQVVLFQLFTGYLLDQELIASPCCLPMRRKSPGLQTELLVFHQSTIKHLVDNVS